MPRVVSTTSDETTGRSTAAPFLIATVLAAALLGGWWFGGRGPDPPPLLAAPAAAATATPSLTVHVSGAVAVPGVVEVPAGSRVADAIAAAGGIVSAADPGAVNLAAPLRDGQQIVVPRAGEGVPPAAASGGGIRINAASVSELEQLPGVGPVLAERIAAHRDEHGPFGTAEDLLDVPGIGEAKLAALRDAVIVP